MYNKDKKNIIYVSLGNYCLTSMLLKENNLKTESHPFDWIITSIENINHILSDNFIQFIKKEHFINYIKNNKCKTINKFYFYKTLKIFPKEKCDFQHHNMLNNNDYNYFKRCIDRFNTLNERYNNIIFIMIQPLYLNNNEINYKEINNLYINLKKKFKNIKLIIFNILKKNNTILKMDFFENKNLILVELNTKMIVGNYGMLYFDKRGIEKFLEIIKNINNI
jgi:hypothetical protein